MRNNIGPSFSLSPAEEEVRPAGEKVPSPLALGESQNFSICR